MPDRQSSTVTFLFTDIEGSTRVLHALGREAFAAWLSGHCRLLREAFLAAGGQELGTEGDSFFVAFRTAADAIAGAAAGQTAIARHDWGDWPAPSVRMGIHTGEALFTEGSYVGGSVHRAARICATARGGQILVSQTTHDLLADEEGSKARFILEDLGQMRLKDFDRPIRLYQLTPEGLPRRRSRRRRIERRPAIAVALAVPLAGAAALAAFASGAFSTSATVAKPRVTLLRSLGNSQPVVIPKRIGAIGDPPAYPASRALDHCGLWWQSWFVRQGAASVPYDEEVEIAAPAGADVTVTRIGVHIFRSYRPESVSFIECQASGAGPTPGTQVNLDLSHPGSVPTIASQLGGKPLRSPPAVVNIAPGHTEYLVLIPHGDGFYEWSLTLRFTVDQRDQTVVIGSPADPLRTWLGGLANGGTSTHARAYDFDAQSRTWRVLVGNCRFPMLSACPRVSQHST